MLISIDNKITGPDGRVALIEVLHKEFQRLRHSLEYSRQQTDRLTQESLQQAATTMSSQLSSITTQLVTVTTENQLMKETINGLWIQQLISTRNQPEMQAALCHLQTHDDER